MNINSQQQDSGEEKGYMVKMLLSPLRKYLDDDNYTEVLVNQPQEVWLKGHEGWKRDICSDLTEDTMVTLTRAVAAFNKTKESALNYLTLPDGERCTIIKSPACFHGYFGLLIRKYVEVSLTIDDYIKQGAFETTQNTSFNILDRPKIEEYLSRNDEMRITKEDACLLTYLDERNFKDFLLNAVLFKKNIVVSGATNSGKTTLMRAIIEFVPTNERIITLEDVHELKLERFPNKLPLIFGRGEGQISAQQLLEACMRATPDRIFLAELRGVETWDYMQSLNTGHPGSVTSVHSSSSFRAYMRIATLANQSAEGRALGFDVIKDEVYNTIDIVIHMENRKITQIFFDPIFILKRINQN